MTDFNPREKLYKKHDRVFINNLLTLTIPATIQSLMLALVAVADAMMLGRVNQNAMAAVTLATQIQFIQNMFLWSGASAASVLGAQYWGKGDKQTIVKIMHIMMKFGAIISILFFLLCEFMPLPIMKIFTNEPVLQKFGVQYLKISAFSYLLTGLSQSYLTIMKVSGHAKQTAIISSSAVILNIILNALLIFGLFDLPAMNVRGAALATAITRVTELLACILLSHRRGYIKPDFAHFFAGTPALFKDFARIMMPILGASMFWGIGFTSYTAFMGHLGTDAAAANSVAAVVRDMICCITDGMAIGGGILIGNELGAGRLDRARIYGDRLIKISFMIGFTSTIIMLALTPFTSHVVELTDGARECLYGMMLVMSIYMIGRAVNTVTINGVFAAGGDTLYDVYSLAVVMWCIAIPLAAAGTFYFHWSPVVVYACTCLDEVGKIPWTIIHYRKYKWVRNLTR